MKTKTEILKETYEYYSDPSNRAIDEDGNCQYHTIDGKQCAVGRCLKDPIAMSHCTKTVNGMNGEGIRLEGLLKADYRGNPSIFWSELQSWHDFHDNFTPKGISELGNTAYQELLTKYANQ